MGKFDAGRAARAFTGFLQGYQTGKERNELKREEKERWDKLFQLKLNQDQRAQQELDSQLTKTRLDMALKLTDFLWAVEDRQEHKRIQEEIKTILGMDPRVKEAYDEAVYRQARLRGQNLLNQGRSEEIQWGRTQRGRQEQQWARDDVMRQRMKDLIPQALKEMGIDEPELVNGILGYGQAMEDLSTLGDKQRDRERKELAWDAFTRNRGYTPEFMDLWSRDPVAMGEVNARLGGGEGGLSTKDLVANLKTISSMAREDPETGKMLFPDESLDPESGAVVSPPNGMRQIQGVLQAAAMASMMGDLHGAGFLNEDEEGGNGEGGSKPGSPAKAADPTLEEKLKAAGASLKTPGSNESEGSRKYSRGMAELSYKVPSSGIADRLGTAVGRDMPNAFNVVDRFYSTYPINPFIPTEGWRNSVGRILSGMAGPTQPGIWPEAVPSGWYERMQREYGNNWYTPYGAR